MVLNAHCKNRYGRKVGILSLLKLHFHHKHRATHNGHKEKQQGALASRETQNATDNSPGNKDDRDGGVDLFQVLHERFHHYFAVRLDGIHVDILGVHGERARGWGEGRTEQKRCVRSKRVQKLLVGGRCRCPLQCCLGSRKLGTAVLALVLLLLALVLLLVLLGRFHGCEYRLASGPHSLALFASAFDGQ